MATRAEVVQELAKRRFNKALLPNLTRAQVKQAAQGMTDAQWDQIIANIRSVDNSGDTGLLLRQVVHAHLMTIAVSDIEGRLAPDDTLDLSEITDLF